MTKWILRGGGVGILVAGLAGAAGGDGVGARPVGGVGGFGGDGGPATRGQLTCPDGMIVDSSGALLICDTGNHRIRKVDASGTITTIAGSGFMGYDGDGKPATQAGLYDPIGIALLPDGAVAFTDTGNAENRTGTPDGVIHP